MLLFQAPPNVSERQWKILRSKDSTNEAIAVTVREIVEILLPDLKKVKPKGSRTPKVMPSTPVTPSYNFRDRGVKPKRFRDDDTLSEERSMDFSLSSPSTVV